MGQFEFDLEPIIFDPEQEPLFVNDDKQLRSYTGTMGARQIKVIVQANDSSKDLETLSRSLCKHHLFPDFIRTVHNNTNGEFYMVLEHGIDLLNFIHATKPQSVLAINLLKDVIRAVQFISEMELSVCDLNETDFFVENMGLDNYSVLFCSLETLTGPSDEQSTLAALINLLQRMSYLFHDTESIKLLQELISEAKSGTRTLHELCKSMLFWSFERRIMFYDNITEWIYSVKGMQTIINAHHKTAAIARVYVKTWDEKMTPAIKEVFKEAVLDPEDHGTPTMETEFAKKPDSVCDLIKGVKNIYFSRYKYSARDPVFKNTKNLDDYLSFTFPNLFIYTYDSICRAGKREWFVN